MRSAGGQLKGAARAQASSVQGPPDGTEADSALPPAPDAPSSADGASHHSSAATAGAATAGGATAASDFEDSKSARAMRHLEASLDQGPASAAAEPAYAASMHASDGHSDIASSMYNHAWSIADDGQGVAGGVHELPDIPEAPVATDDVDDATPLPPMHGPVPTTTRPEINHADLARTGIGFGMHTASCVAEAASTTAQSERGSEAEGGPNGAAQTKSVRLAAAAALQPRADSFARSAGTGSAPSALHGARLCAPARPVVGQHGALGCCNELFTVLAEALPAPAANELPEKGAHAAAGGAAASTCSSIDGSASGGGADGNTGSNTSSPRRGGSAAGGSSRSGSSSGGSSGDAGPGPGTMANRQRLARRALEFDAELAAEAAASGGQLPAALEAALRRIGARSGGSPDPKAAAQQQQLPVGAAGACFSNAKPSEVAFLTWHLTRLCHLRAARHPASCCRAAQCGCAC